MPDPEPLPQPTVAWLLFSFKGRIARQSYILGALFMMTLQALVLIRLVMAEEAAADLTMWGFVLIIGGIAATWSALAMTVKRLHDLDLPAILAICLLIPAISWIFLIVMMVLPSKQETNRHGPPPFPKA